MVDPTDVALLDVTCATWFVLEWPTTPPKFNVPAIFNGKLLMDAVSRLFNEKPENLSLVNDEKVDVHEDMPLGFNCKYTVSDNRSGNLAVSDEGVRSLQQERLTIQSFTAAEVELHNVKNDIEYKRKRACSHTSSLMASTTDSSDLAYNVLDPCAIIIQRARRAITPLDEAIVGFWNPAPNDSHM